MILTEQHIDLNMRETSKDGILRHLAGLLCEDGTVTDKDKFLQDVYYRETLGETGIGSGIAIPHGKSDAVARTAMAVGINDQGVEWESLDDTPIRCVVLFAVREDDKSAMVKMLSQVAVKFCDEDVIEQIFHCASKQDVIRLLDVQLPQT